MKKRNIFGELMEGVAAMKRSRKGKITLRTHKVEAAPLPDGDGAQSRIRAASRTADARPHVCRYLVAVRDRPRARPGRIRTLPAAPPQGALAGRRRSL